MSRLPDSDLQEIFRLMEAGHPLPDKYRSLLFGPSLSSDHLKDVDLLGEAFEQNTSVMLVIDPVSAQIIDANASAASYYGYSREQLRTMSIEDINTLPTDFVARERLKAARAECNFFNFTHRLASGEEREVEVHSTPIKTADRTVVLSIIHDITARKQAEQANALLALRTQTLLQAASDGIHVVDDNGFIVEANVAFCNMLGYTREEALQLHVSDWDVNLPPEIAPTRIATQMTGSDGFETLHRRKDGSVLDVEVNVVGVMLEGRHHLFCSSRDITERKQVEQALRLSERQLRETQAIAGLGTYVLDIPTGQWSSSTILDKEFGIDESYDHSVAAWTEIIAPDDRKMMADYFANEVVGRGQPFDKEYRIIRQSDGTIRWVHGLGRLEFDADNAPVKMLGTIQDITDRKQVEEVQSFLAQTGSGTGDEPFFQVLARFLGHKLSMDFVCIDRLEGDGLTARTVAVWCDGQFQDDLTYDLKDTPCGALVGQTVCCFPAHVAEAFPNDQVLQDLNAESYVGVTLWGHTGQPIGLIAVIGRKRLMNRQLAELTLKMVSVRAAGELERLDGEKALRDSESRFRMLFERSPLGYQSLNGDGRFIEVNQAWLDTLGYERDEVIGHWFGDFLPPAYQSAFRERFPRFKEVGEVHNEFEMIHRNGSIVNIVFDGKVSYDQDHHFKQTHCIMHDVTEVKRAEAEKAKLEAQLQQAQKLEALGVLVAGVAHNTNNLLAAIMGTASVREKTATSSLDLEAYRTIVTACKRGRDMVNSLTQFAKPSLSRQAPIDSRALLAEVRTLLKNTTQDRIEVVEILCDEPLWIHGDAGSISNAFMNLCLNAMDAMPDGGTLTLRTALADRNWAEISFEDTGEGMSPEVLARVMEPFFTTKPLGKGTGLGLSMTHGVIKAHGGTLEIQSSPGSGTTVKVGFPRIPAPTHPGSIAPTPAVHSWKNVLLADDDEDVRFLVSRMLKASGLEVEAVEGGEEVLEMLTKGRVPDLIILDQNMPGMNGVQTMEKVLVLFPDMPILISSGQPDIENWACFRRPSVSVISKPFEMDELLTKLDSFATTRRLSSESGSDL